MLEAAFGEQGTLTQRAVHRSLLGTLEALAAPPKAEPWSELLQAAVLGVPGAEGGHIRLRQGGGYAFVSQIGHDERLLEVTFSPEESVAWYGGPEGWLLGLPRLYLLPDLRRRAGVRRQSPETVQLLEGCRGRVQASLSLPLVLNRRVVAELDLESYSDPGAFGTASVQAAQSFALHLLALLVARREQGTAETAYESTLRAVGIALEARDRETAGHTDRVARLAERLGAALKLCPAELRDLRWGAYLHDIGKLMIPDAVLLKPGRFSQTERAVMQSHAELGERLIQNLPFVPESVRQIVRSHHERWDGGGYPDGLAGEQIPPAARAFAVCDVFDAMRSERVYKAAMSFEQALLEIARCGQTGHLDPEMVRAFLGSVEEG